MGLGVVLTVRRREEEEGAVMVGKERVAGYCLRCSFPTYFVCRCCERPLCLKCEEDVGCQCTRDGSERRLWLVR